MSKGNELVGLKFNRLAVISLHSIRVSSEASRERCWECICDCGKTTIVLGSHLKSGHTKSCGCLMIETSKALMEKNKRKRGKQHGLSLAYSTYRQRAKKNSISFTISMEQFNCLTSQNCFYCNAEPCNLSKGKYGGENYKYNGLDRKDNYAGYDMDNIVPCCKFCNIFKNNFLSVEETKHLISELKRIRGIDENNGIRLRIHAT